LIKVISMVEKNGSKLLNWMIKKIAWISYKEIYKAAKEQIITEILIHLSLKKSIVLLIIAFI
jgi:nucleoside diphosphate kinase